MTKILTFADMVFTAKEIAGLLGGEIVGDPEAAVHKLSKIEEGETGSLTFLANPKYKSFIYSTQATVTIVGKDFEPEQALDTTLIKVDDAYQAFSKLLEYYNQVKHNKTGLESPVFVAPSATYGADLYLGAFSYLGENVRLGEAVKIYPNCHIGDNTHIGDRTIVHPGARIGADTVIGADCIVHSGVVIGADGFGFAPNAEGGYDKVPQTGNVIIEDRVEIGAGTTIDRATLGSTRICTGVKLDNQIQIAHNVEIGAHTVIAAQTGIAGSTKIGKHCQIGGQVGIVGHITIGDGVRIQAQSGISGNIKDNAVLQGTPAFNLKDFNKSYVHFKRLPENMELLEALSKKLSDRT